MTPSERYKKAIVAFIAETDIELDALQAQINKEEEKEETDNEKIDDLYNLKDSIENTLDIVNEIETE